MCQKVIDRESDSAVHKWLRGAQFGEAIVGNTRELCALCLSDEDGRGVILDHRWNLLKMALTTQLNTGRLHKNILMIFMRF